MELSIYEKRCLRAGIDPKTIANIKPLTKERIEEWNAKVKLEEAEQTHQPK